MIKRCNVSEIKDKLYKLISIHKKGVFILSASIFFAAALVICALQTLNYHETKALYVREVEKNQQLNEYLELGASTIARLESHMEKRNQEAKENEDKWAAEIAECRELYFKASFEDSHVKYAMRLYDMDGPLFVPAHIDKGLADFIVKHFTAMYTGDVETYKSTVSPTTWSHEYLMGRLLTVAENEYYRAEVKFINEWNDTWWNLSVTVLEQEFEDSEPRINVWPVILAHTDGKWFVNDYH